MTNPFHTLVFDVAAFFPDGPPPNRAAQDYEFALKFIYSYNGSEQTFNAYRREVERLLQWAWQVRRCSVLDLQRHDIEEFIAFCIHPPRSWIGTKNVSRFLSVDGCRVANPEWRPFVAKVPKAQHKNGRTAKVTDFELSQASIKAIFAILSSFYTYLIQVLVTEANPVSAMRQKSKFIQKNTAVNGPRRISNLQWDFVISTVEKMALAAPDVHERSLFILNCLFSMYLRISELVANSRSVPVMGDFRQDSHGNWWFYVVGKGNKQRQIAVCTEMLNALQRYREFLGLTPLPSPGDRHPLVEKRHGKGPIKSERHVRAIVQECFDRAYDSMVQDGLVKDADHLRASTVHWLRHTGISEDVKRRPRDHVRDDAGHSSILTTDKYVESELLERHKSAKDKPVRDVL